MLRISALIFTFLLIAVNANGQFRTVHGKVTNAALEPIAFVNVSVVEKAYLGTTTDMKGDYSIKIQDGSYIFVFSFVGYQTLKIPVTVKGGDITQNVILELSAHEIQGGKVTSKKKDRSEEIIRHVIENKHRYGNLPPHSVKAYIKAVQQESTYQKKKDTTVESPNLNMAEIYMTLNRSDNDKIKEERTGVNIRGNSEELFYLTHTDGDFNWYFNLLSIPALSQSPFLSPISNSGLFAYKFKMLESYYVNEQKYYRIKVTPTLTGNALVSGELVIMDSLWCISELKLSFPKYHMVEYDAFEVSQKYNYTDSFYYLDHQEFRYTARYGKTRNSGRTVVYYSDYRFNQAFKKRFFNTELSSTTQEAYERDTGFWNNIRKEPFSKKEVDFIRRSDSAKALTLQKSWQDSVDREYNAITFKKIFFSGQSFYKRSSERYWSFKPLIFAYTPVYIAGPRINYWVSYERTFKNKTTLGLDPSFNYGFLNNDLKGSFGIERLYDPFRRGLIRASIGSDFGIINPFDAWVKIFQRSNFFVQDQASVYHRIELVNGLYLGTGIEYSNRKSLQGYTFDPKGDSLYNEPNTPVIFSPYMALYGTFSLTYIPFQKYIREPYQKLILGSDWPELTVRYRKGVNGLGSTVDFDYLEFQAEQEFKLGLLGNSKYRVVSGEFLNHRDLRLVDYKFQRRAGPYFFSNPLFAFQGIDTTYSTIRRFYEAHYLHRFNGALINKIPFLKKLNIIECVGGGLLYTRERNLKYMEAFIGIEKVVRLWKERIRVGVFYVAGVSNKFNYLPQLKFTIEPYDKRNNRFSY